MNRLARTEAGRSVFPTPSPALGRALLPSRRLEPPAIRRLTGAEAAAVPHQEPITNDQ